MQISWKSRKGYGPRGVYIPKFFKISVKISVCNFWGSYTLIVALMRVKFGMEEWTELNTRQISPYRCNVSPLRAKNLKIVLWATRYFGDTRTFSVDFCISESWARVHSYKPSPIHRHQNHFCTPTPSYRNLAHNLWRSKAWRTNRQTNRQKNSTFLATPAAGEIRAPPNLAWW